MANCPVCGGEMNNFTPERGIYDCPRCGEFWLHPGTEVILKTELMKSPHRDAMVSHRLRRRERDEHEIIGPEQLAGFWSGEKLPPASRQADDVILWCGDHQLSPDQFARCASLYLSAWVGTSINPHDPRGGLVWLFKHLNKQGLLEYSWEGESNDPRDFCWLLRLTMDGWQRYAELKERRLDSRTAFMAMKFGDAELDKIVDDFFRPAVAQAGFELRKLTDEQPAGLIDNQIRAAILSGRFVIADLSHANNGVYWEAGYAEGLGLPVIYTCEKSIWEEKRTHFDTNHMLTIPWSKDNPQQAAELITATIRSTLRYEAR